MKKTFWIVAILALLVAGIAYRFQSKDKATEEAGKKMAANRTPTVEVTEAKAGEITRSIDMVGTLESANTAALSPRFTGRILAVNVREGDQVQAGQVLVRLDPTEVQSEIAQKRSDLAEAKYRLAQAQLGTNSNSATVEGTYASQQAALNSALADEVQTRQASESLVAGARAALTTAEATLRSSTAKVRSAEAELKRDQTSLANAKSKVERLEALLSDGYVSVQAVEDARTQLAVAQGAVLVSENDKLAAEEAVVSAKAEVESKKQQLAAAEKKAAADIAAAKTRVTQARANLNVASANRSQTEAYSQNLAALKASVASAEAQLRISENKLRDIDLVAPFSGTISERNANVGSLATPGTPLVVVNSSGDYFVRSSVPVDVASQLRQGMSTRFYVENIEEPFLGKIAYVSSVAELQSRQITVLVRMDQKDPRLKVGMYGRVEVILNRLNADVVIPREALKTENGKTTVAVLDEEMKVSIREVTLGEQNSTVAQVVSGLRAGDKVVIMNYQPLRDGQTVRLPGQGNPKGGGGEGKGKGKGGPGEGKG